MEETRARVTLAARLQLPIPATWEMVIEAVGEMCNQNKQLRQHIEDLNHDFNAAIKHCNDQHVEGVDFE